MEDDWAFWVFIGLGGIFFIIWLFCVWLICYSFCNKSKSVSGNQEQTAHAPYIYQTNQPWSLSTSSTNQTLSSPPWPANQTSMPPWPANQPWSVSSANQILHPRPDDGPSSYDALYMPPSYNSIEIHNQSDIDASMASQSALFSQFSRSDSASTA
jgi:hypothetical protein